MYCEECKVKPAMVHLTQIVNGKKVENHLCEECAAQKGGIFLNLDQQFSLSDFLGSFFSSNYNMRDKNQAVNQGVCANCKMNYSDIRQSGKLGCSECYLAFGEDMEPSLRRIHGNTKHMGKIPSRGGEKIIHQKKMDSLKERLQESISREEYEAAAEIRDIIKKLEKNI